MSSKQVALGLMVLGVVYCGLYWSLTSVDRYTKTHTPPAPRIEFKLDGGHAQDGVQK